MHVSRHIAAASAAVVLAIGLGVVPVHATVHEIVGQWCSGQDPLDPPGISREGSRNFAQPLNAAGVVTMTFDAALGGVLVSFDFSHPAVKVQSSGLIIQIGTTDEGTPIFLDVPEPDPGFPAFQHCPALAGL
jgi:hypothetical protein